MVLIKISSIDRYLNKIGGNFGIIAIWEHGSFMEGIADEFSDRDLIIIWEKNIPSAEIRLKIAKELSFDVHEIKDVKNIGQSFDLFSDGKFLFNIAHGTVQREKYYQSIKKGQSSSNVEGILMSISSLSSAKIHFQKNDYVDKLKSKIKISKEIQNKIINDYKTKMSIDLKLLEKSARRNDLLPFLKYLEKILRAMQIIYLLENDKPVISANLFEKRFAKLENDKITSLIRDMTKDINTEQIFNKILKLSKNMGIKKSEKMRA